MCQERCVLGNLSDLSHRGYILVEVRGEIIDKLASEIILGDEHYKENKMKQWATNGLQGSHH